MKLAEFFQDDTNRLSMMRLSTLILVVSGVTAVFCHIDTMAALGMISIGITGKAVQSFAEGK